jgi:hypothetical protein
MREIIYCTGTIKDGIKFIITCYRIGSRVELDIIQR